LERTPWLKQKLDPGEWPVMSAASAALNALSRFPADCTVAVALTAKLTCLYINYVPIKVLLMLCFVRGKALALLARIG
jgi:hypothetical protein